MMNVALKLRNAPIVEAVLDVDCDLRPGFDLMALEEQARERFRSRYPKLRKQFLQEVEVQGNAEAISALSARRGVQSLQFLQDDERQLVQLRWQGFSFNRLAPYSTLDDYLPEIEKNWQLYTELTMPVVTRVVRLRYVNRILLPTRDAKVDLEEYFAFAPKAVDENTMDLTGFFVHHTAIERKTKHQINVVLTAQPPEADKQPIILDVGVETPLREDPNNWTSIKRDIYVLRHLKNRVFFSMVTEKCLQVFQ